MLPRSIDSGLIGSDPLEAVDRRRGLVNACATRFTELLADSGRDLSPHLLDAARRLQAEFRGTTGTCPVVRVAAEYARGQAAEAGHCVMAKATTAADCQSDEASAEDAMTSRTPRSVEGEGDDAAGLPQGLVQTFGERFGGLDCLRIANLYEDSVGLWGLYYSVGGAARCEQVIQRCLASMKDR